MHPDAGAGAGREATPAPPPFRLAVLTNGVVPWLFMITGPYLLILNAALASRVPEDVIISWFMAGPIAGGVLTVLLAVIYRQPVCCSMTMHGSLLVASALAYLPVPEAVGAYLMTGVLVIALAATGTASYLLDRLPLPIVMAMVLGVIFPFGLGIVSGVSGAPVLAGGTILVFLAATRWWRREGGVPAIFWAALFGLVAASLTGVADWDQFTVATAQPLLILPEFTLRGLVDLGLPLTVMVIAVHGAQSMGIIRGAGLPYRTTPYTLAVGIGSLPTAFYAGPPLSLLGPPLGMLVAGIKDGRDDHRWTASVVFGLLLILLGVFAPALAAVPRVVPAPLMAAIAGLAVLDIMMGYLARTFAGPFRYGAITAFLITAAKVSFFDVGSPFWGVVAGLAVSALMEPGDFRALARRAGGQNAQANGG